MNIDFNTDPGFSAYVLLLMFSGIVMLILASPTVKRSTNGTRALNALFGVGFLGYGFYLAFMFQGGGYVLFFQAFILPVLMIVRTIRGALAARSQRLLAQASRATFDQHTPPTPAPAGSRQPSGQWGTIVSHGEDLARP